MKNVIQSVRHSAVTKIVATAADTQQCNGGFCSDTNLKCSDTNLKSSVAIRILSVAILILRAV